MFSMRGMMSARNVMKDGATIRNMVTGMRIRILE
jgi:hypothetical protein